MTVRSGRGGVDLGLRTIGLALGGAALGAVHLLRSLALAHPGRPGTAEMLIALILFLCGSIGSALFFTGDGIFDRIEVSSRWRTVQAFPMRQAIEPKRVAAEVPVAEAETAQA